MVTAVLILGDQLSDEIAALRHADKSRDLIVMAEVMDEAEYVPHHPKKIILILSAMRKFAARLRDAGWRVAYTKLDDPENTHSLLGELDRHTQAAGAGARMVTEPGEWRLRLAFEEAGLKQLPDDRFLCSRARFADWADGRKSLRMEYFYRDMRRLTGYLMDGDKPAGGQWNYDHDNRKPAQVDLLRRPPLRHAPCPVTQEVIALVETRFGNRFGDPRPFWFATDRAQARASLADFIQHHLADFGTYQDAMLAQDAFLHHSILSPYLNIGLLSPTEVCDAAQDAWRSGAAPINSAEGFIRQIIGWREYVRGLYDWHGPGYTAQNGLGATRPLPGFYWDAKTDMACIRAVVTQTREQAYAHHIQRLMVTGNFALLAGLDPAEVHAWYLAVYADAFEWVEAPNTLGIALHADGGVMASKPYAASGAYIDRMSDYCASCAYDRKDREGPRACPFNSLYWHFLDRNREKFVKNPRMAQMYRTWDRMADSSKSDTLARAEVWLKKLEKGEKV